VSSIGSFSNGDLVQVSPGSPPAPGGLQLASLRGEVTGDPISSERVQDLVLTEVATGRGSVLVGSREPLPGPRVHAQGPLGTFARPGSAPLTVLFAEEAQPAPGGASRLVQRALVRLDGGAPGTAEFEEDALWGATTRPLIRRGLLSDTYVVFQGLLPDGSVSLTVKEIPLASLVWLGVGLLMAGGLALILVSTPRGRTQNQE